jgi:RHS repeat-associated protein
VNGFDTGYLYEGTALLLEYDSSGVQAKYAYDPRSGDPLSVARGTSTYYYATDLQGSVTALFNASNQVLNQYSYLPFGETQSVTEQVPNRLRYTGREYESESGLYYNFARWYDAQLHRFVSEDPIGINGGTNSYTYSTNEPVNHQDASGLSDATPRPRCTFTLFDILWSFYCEFISGNGTTKTPYDGAFFTGGEITGLGPEIGRDNPFAPPECCVVERVVYEGARHFTIGSSFTLFNISKSAQYNFGTGQISTTQGNVLGTPQLGGSIDFALLGETPPKGWSTFSVDVGRGEHSGVSFGFATDGSALFPTSITGHLGTPWRWSLPVQVTIDGRSPIDVPHQYGYSCWKTAPYC